MGHLYHELRGGKVSHSPKTCVWGNSNFQLTVGVKESVEIKNVQYLYLSTGALHL